MKIKWFKQIASWFKGFKFAEVLIKLKRIIGEIIQKYEFECPSVEIFKKQNRKIIKIKVSKGKKVQN